MPDSSSSDRLGLKPLRPLAVPFATGVPLLGLGPVSVAAAVKPFGQTQMFVVLAAIAVGSLVTPGVGLWAEHHARHRRTQIVGLCVAAAGYASLMIATAPVLLILAGLCIGAGTAASLTMTLCNAVRSTGSGVLERRLGVITAVAQTGAFVGFVGARLLRGRTGTNALAATAVCCVIAAVVVFVIVVAQDPRPVDGGVSLEALMARTVRMMRSTFGIFWIGWTLTFLGAMTIAGSFSDVLTAGFGVSGAIVTIALAVGLALRAALSMPAGELAQRIGAAPAMHALQAVRLGACAAMVVAAAVAHSDASGVTDAVLVTSAVVIVASVGFVAVPSSALSVRLTGVDMAAALGAFFTAEFIGTVGGFVLAEAVSARGDYMAVPIAATTVIVVGVLLLFGARRQLVGRTVTETTLTEPSTSSS